MIRSKTIGGLVLTALITVTGQSTYAITLVSGDLSKPLPGTNSATLASLTGGTLLDSLVANFLSPYWSGQVYTTVIKETTGKLSFLYQIKMVTGGDHNITRMTTTDFTGFATDVDYLSDSFTGFGFVAPVNTPSNPFFADRQTADVVGFAFRDGSTIMGLTAGQTSSVMYVRTDATNYTKGDSFIIDGKVASVSSFAPTASVPGPLALIPFGVGLLSSFARKRRK